MWRAFVEPFEVVPFDRAAAETHGRLRFALRASPIGERDLLVAATAVAHGCAVVTENAREFRRVPGLSVEEWGEQGDSVVTGLRRAGCTGCYGVERAPCAGASSSTTT